MMYLRLYVLAAVLILLALAGCSSDEPDAQSAAPVRGPTDTSAIGATTAIEDPKQAPDLSLATMAGGTIEVPSPSGEVLLLNFWATWCAPCREEIPDLIALQKELGDRGFTVVGIAMDQDGEEVVRPYVEEHDINYPIVLDSDATISQNFDQVYGLPTTIVIGPNGYVRYRILGIFPTEKMKPKLLALMKETAQASDPAD